MLPDHEWTGSPCPRDPDNFWIDDATGERVCAATGARTPNDNTAYITGEIDQSDLAEGGDGIVYAGSVEEAAGIRANLLERGLKLHGVPNVDEN